MSTFNTLLIANRGEIAVRIIKTAKQMGYQTVAVYSHTDANSLHVQQADKAVCIGADEDQPYLNIATLLLAAERTQASAIHPGYGFLSESAEFSKRCKQADITFVGPNEVAIAIMGNKTLAREAMAKVSVPLIPGYEGTSNDDAVLQKEAGRIGYPVMIKAAAGGGGRGIRLVNAAGNLVNEMALARAEALSSFGSDELLLEKCVEQARHIEIQVFADQLENTVYLGERDCSMQRRHQKVIEESPAPIMSDELRKAMGEAAVKAAKAVDYVGAGTVEFLVTESGEFYFLEMNTRLQVEHPVTELVTGLDLVEWQLRVAAGEALPLTQDDITLTGHAIEVRLYAEDSDQGFVPQTGDILTWKMPTGHGVRVDAGIMQGQQISPFYDSMLAKIITYGDTRNEALRRLKRALKDSVLLGLTTNKHFLLGLLDDPGFMAGRATTRHIEDNILLPDGVENKQTLNNENWALAAVLLSRTLGASGWRSTGQLRWPVRLKLTEDIRDVYVSQEGDVFQIEFDNSNPIRLAVLSENEGELVVLLNNVRQTINIAFDRSKTTLHLGTQEQTLTVEKLSFSEKKASEETGADLLAPMSGRIAEVKVKVGESISKGDVLVVLESMKMFQELSAATDGVVKEVFAKEETQVNIGETLVEIDVEN